MRFQLNLAPISTSTSKWPIADPPASVGEALASCSQTVFPTFSLPDAPWQVRRVLAGFFLGAWLLLKAPGGNAPGTKVETNCLELWLRVLEAGKRFCLVTCDASWEPNRSSENSPNLIGERRRQQGGGRKMRHHWWKVLRFKKAFRKLVVAVTGLVLAAPAFAQVSGSSPWENAVNVLQAAFTSTIARGLSLVAIVVSGLTFAFGEGGSKRVLAGVLLGVGMAIAAVNFLAWLFP